MKNLLSYAKAGRGKTMLVFPKEQMQKMDCGGRTGSQKPLLGTLKQGSRRKTEEKRLEVAFRKHN